MATLCTLWVGSEYVCTWIDLKLAFIKVAHGICVGARPRKAPSIGGQAHTRSAWRATATANGFWCRDIARGGAARVRAVAEAAVARVTPLIGYTKADKRLRYADVGRPRQRRARLRPPSLRHGGGRRHARGRRWRTMYVRWYSNSMRAPGRIRLKLLGFFPFGGRSAS